MASTTEQISTAYSNAYKYTCRAVWYENGCQSPKVCIDKEMFPPDEHGRVVTHGILKHWVTGDNWYIWKDEQDAALASKIDNELVARKFLLVKEQLSQAREIRNKAFMHLKDTDFDSSAAANQAFFKAAEQERSLVGIEEMFEKLSKMDTPSIRARLKELAERAEATEVIDVTEVAEVAEVVENGQ